MRIIVASCIVILNQRFHAGPLCRDTGRVDWGLALAVDRDETARRSGEATLLPSSGSQEPELRAVDQLAHQLICRPSKPMTAIMLIGAPMCIVLGVMLYKILFGKVPYQAPRPGADPRVSQARKPDTTATSQCVGSTRRCQQFVCERWPKIPVIVIRRRSTWPRTSKNWLVMNQSVRIKPGSANLMRWVRKHRVFSHDVGRLNHCVCDFSVDCSGRSGNIRSERKPAAHTSVMLRDQTAEAARIESLRATALVSCGHDCGRY